MNEAAQNAFLKTLEEPPPDVVFLLITSRPQMLRATIRSRCQRLDLKPLPVAAAQAALVERWGLPERRAELLARLSRGRLGWALAAQANEEVLRLRREALNDIRNLSRHGIVERFARANDLAMRFARQRDAVLDVLDLWGQWWRDVLLVAGGCDEAITNVDLADILRAESAHYDVRRVASFLRSLAAARRRLEENVNARLALEVLLLDLPPQS
jgi:DNA polymerase-3 subunit delta'